ncbi:MAG: hypothetical protein ABR980_10900 [Ignavibacteriaceae bacterium]|jgi:hypothetical protein
MEEILVEIFDRFKFDHFFKILLKNGFDNDEALNFILNNCKLSTLVYQERIENEFYKRMSANDKLSDDLMKLISEIKIEIISKLN